MAFGPEGAITAGDIDGDGFAELVVGNGGAHSVTDGVVNIFSAPGKTPPAFPLISSFLEGSKLTIPRHTNPAPQATTIQAFIPFQIQNIFYNPPGGASVQQFRDKLLGELFDRLANR